MQDIKLTNAERMIMEIIWQNGQLSNGDILNRLGDSIEWSRHTVKTYTNSLSQKGLLGINQISPRKIKFYPIMTKEKYLASATSSHLRKNYKDLSFMVAGLIDNSEVTDDEINALEKMIKDYKEK